MWTETFDEQHKQGLEALTGGTKHRYYFNERKTYEGYQYDVVEFPHKPSVPEIKSAIIGEEHTIEDELKIIRKALSVVIDKIGAEGEAIDEFKTYHELVSAITKAVNEI